MRIPIRLIGAALALAALPGVAAAESVAYVDGNEVWVSTVDGARKARLSSGENQWRDVAHASGGSVVGVKLESGKIAQLSFFKQWGADGAAIREGILPNKHIGWSLAAPLNIDLTPDGGAMVWGYSALFFSFPTSTLDKGAYFTSTQNIGGLQPLTMSDKNYPSLAGNRLVSISGRTIRVMNNTTSAPFSDQAADFADWLDLSGIPLDSTWDLNAAVTSDDGHVVAFHMTQYTNGTLTDGKIGVVGTGGLGLAPLATPDCWLPTVGIPKSEPSISADGTLIAWQDDQGVKVAPMPTGNADLCVFPVAPTIVSATGIQPDFGGMVLPPTPTPTPTTPIPTSTAAPATITAAKLVAKGVVVTVTPARAGKVTVTLTVPGALVGQRTKKSVTIASVSKTVAAGAKATFTLRPLAKYRAKVKKLRGKKATIRITVAGVTTTRVVKLR